LSRSPIQPLRPSPASRGVMSSQEPTTAVSCV
jgi:hypothetical protein